MWDKKFWFELSKRFSHLSFDLKGCFRMNIEKVYIEQEPITYGLLIWGISNDMFKIPRKSLEFLLLSFVSTESCVGDKRGKRSKRERQTGWFSKAWARGWVLKESESILRRKTRLERRSPRACVRAIGAWKISKDLSCVCFPNRPDLRPTSFTGNFQCW